MVQGKDGKVASDFELLSIVIVKRFLSFRDARCSRRAAKKDGVCHACAFGAKRTAARVRGSTAGSCGSIRKLPSRASSSDVTSPIRHSEEK